MAKASIEAIGRALLFGDEAFHIGMVDTQNGHIGAAARTTLGDFAKSMVVDAQKTDGAGCDAGARQHVVATRTQARK